MRNNIVIHSDQVESTFDERVEALKDILRSMSVEELEVFKQVVREAYFENKEAA